MVFMLHRSSYVVDLLLLATFVSSCSAVANQARSGGRLKRDDLNQTTVGQWKLWDNVSSAPITEKEAEYKQIVINTQGEIVIHAYIEGGEAEKQGLFKMLFEKGSSCGAKVDMSVQPRIMMRIERSGACLEGVIFCYVGRLDPENELIFDRELNTQFHLSNEEGNEIAEKCKNAAHQYWKSWNNYTLHGFSLKTNGSSSEVLLTSSTHRDPAIYPAEGAFNLNLGEPYMLGGFVENRGTFNFPTHMRNGMLLRQERADFCLSYDLLAGVKEDTELFGLIIPNEKQTMCLITITIGGSGLRKYTGKNTAEKQKEDDKERKNPATKWTKVYDNFFEPNNLVWITDNEELPESLKNEIFLETVEGKNGEEKYRVVITSQGQERIFTVANKNDTELNFTWVRPAHDKFCAKAGQFEKNEMVIVYNKRPDCSVRFQWGERKAKCIDDMGYGDAVLSIKDQPIHIEDGDEFHTVTQFNEPAQLCRGSCPMEPEKIKPEHKGLTGMDDKEFLWHFVLYPDTKRPGNEEVKEPLEPNCVLAVAFDLQEYNFFLPKEYYH